MNALNVLPLSSLMILPSASSGPHVRNSGTFSMMILLGAKLLGEPQDFPRRRPHVLAPRLPAARCGEVLAARACPHQVGVLRCRKCVRVDVLHVLAPVLGGRVVLRMCLDRTFPVVYGAHVYAEVEFMRGFGNPH